MNKYKEAFDELKEVLYLPDKYLEKRLNILQELVEKATPKKPIKKTPKNRERPYCADCGLRLKKTWIACPRCATMIDWSEDTKIL